MTEHISFSVPFNGDEERAHRILAAQLQAWQKQYPGVRLLDAMAIAGMGSYTLTISYERPQGVHRVTL